MTFPVIGVIGGGQLARMMAPAAVELGLELRVLAESEQACAVPVVRHAPVGDYRDLDTLRDFAASVDVVTFDHEHVPEEHLRSLVAEGVTVRPGPDALRHAQDKLVMRRAVADLGLPNPRWQAVASALELVQFGNAVGWPVVLKTPRGGYDGKGVRVVASAEDAQKCADWFNRASQPLLAEAKVDFRRELSALVARRPHGQCVAWDIVESIQRDGVCDEVIAPAPGLSPALAEAILAAATQLAESLDVVGVMAMELFETDDGFLINELAMRPHNTGHWSMDGAVTGQFEQHLRAVADLPLGETRALAERTVMKNILGGTNTEPFSAYPRALAQEPAAKLHFYGKDVRPGRKIGHVNLLSSSPDASSTVPLPEGLHAQAPVTNTPPQVPSADLNVSLRARAGEVALLISDTQPLPPQAPPPQAPLTQPRLAQGERQ